MSTEDLSRVFRAFWWRSTESSRYGASESDLNTTFWCARVADLRLTRLAADDWVSATRERPPLEVVGRVLFRHVRAGAEDAVVAVDRAIARVQRGRRGDVRVVVAASSDEKACQALARLRTAFPKQAPTGCRVEMKFWSYVEHAVSRSQTVDVCAWDAVAPNYGARTRAHLEPLMAAPEVTETGKLVLWLGPPGTGKTFALRALAWERREDVVVHYILDPDMFLERIDYVMSVFADEDDEVELDDATDRSALARLIVLEDAGELLGADAMARKGNGLSRLLNLTDGLPGQATRARVLITTNEDIGRLHPAVTRAGRCASLVRFHPLDEHESAGWLRERGRDDLVRERPASTTIADLFARLRGDARGESGPMTLGFTPRR